MRLFMGTAAVAAALFALPASAQQVTFFTGPAGGSWVPIAGAIKGLFDKAIPDIKVENRPGAGLINLKAIEEGKADLGMGNLISSVDAMNGIGQGITAPYKNNCHMANLYAQVQHIGVRADKGIKTLADLKGKAVGTLPRGNTTEVVAQMILDLSGVGAKGLSKLAYGSIADQTNMFKDGQIDASFNITTAPSGAYMDMANSRPLQMLDIPDDVFEKMRAKNGGFMRYAIPKAMYPGMARDANTVQFPAHLLVSCKLPADLVYKLTAALVEGIPTLESVNASFKGATVKTMGAKTAMPFHPGAEKYFREKGAL
ncbi:MAG: TAXI family TRAP transporter solute-binding subunit [Alphaproteobacteria bacterium]|nr:TAXI family TRAP transporter solute-binding subunit [Alphaproteobacteria bacterium]MCW5742871.1 TAXI family TRAP transporter solute-binding subunit [Alphaproteobacteria bacterium]